jgi:hypothetical protein
VQPQADAGRPAAPTPLRAQLWPAASAADDAAAAAAPPADNAEAARAAAATRAAEAGRTSVRAGARAFVAALVGAGSGLPPEMADAVAGFSACVSLGGLAAVGSVIANAAREGCWVLDLEFLAPAPAVALADADAADLGTGRRLCLAQIYDHGVSLFDSTGASVECGFVLRRTAGGEDARSHDPSVCAVRVFLPEWPWGWRVHSHCCAPRCISPATCDILANGICVPVCSSCRVAFLVCDVCGAFVRCDDIVTTAVSFPALSGRWGEASGFGGSFRACAPCSRRFAIRACDDDESAPWVAALRAAGARFAAFLPPAPTPLAVQSVAAHPGCRKRKRAAAPGPVAAVRA